MQLDLTSSQLMALRSLVAEHLMCPRRSEVYIDCSALVRGDNGATSGIETTHEELLALLLAAPAAPDA